jgi:hypothetical protein
VFLVRNDPAIIEQNDFESNSILDVGNDGSPIAAADDKTLFLHLEDTNSIAVVDASVKLVNDTGAVRTNTTNGYGNASFSLTSGTWRITANITSGEHGITTIVINKTIVITQTVTYSNETCNLKTLKLILKEYDQSAFIEGAKVTAVKTDNPAEIREAYSDSNGVAVIQELESGWHINITVTYTVGTRVFVIDSNIPSNDDYAITTNAFIQSPTAEGYNLSTTTVLCADKDMAGQSEYWALYNVNMTLHEAGTNINISSKQSAPDGYIVWKLPRTTFNFSVSYQSIPRTFDWNNNENYLYYKSWVVSESIKTLTANISLGDTPTQILLKQTPTYYQTGWNVGGAQENQTTTQPFYINIFSGDGMDMVFSYINFQSKEGVSGTGFYNITRKIGSVYTNVNTSEPITTTGGGDFTIQFDSNNYIAGTYRLEMFVSGSGYKISYYFLTINIFNRTTQINRLVPDPDQFPTITRIINDSLTINVNYSSVLPVAAGIEPIASETILNYRVLETGSTGVLTHVGSGNYTFTIQLLTTNGFVAGFYQIEIYGNRTNYAFASRTIGFTIINKTAYLTVNIPNGYETGPNSIKALNSENISFILNYTNENYQSFTDYANTIFTVTMDGNESIIFFVQYLGGSLFNCSVNGTKFGLALGGHTIIINANTPHYVQASQTVLVQLIEAWGTSFEARFFPEAVPRGNNISFISYYSCTEDPRNELPLADGIITQINITIQADLSVYPQIVLTSAHQIAGLWGFTDLKNNGSYGPGYYRIWLNTEVLNLSSDTLFTYRAKIEKPQYSPAECLPSSFVFTIDTSLTPFLPETPELVLSSTELEQNDNSSMFRVKMNVTDTASVHLGELISGALVQYRIKNITNNDILQYGVANSLGNGIYNFSVLTTFVGDFRVDINSTLENYTYSECYFLYGVKKGIIRFNVTFPDDIKIGISSIKIAQGEIAILTSTMINMENPDDVRLYIDGVDQNAVFTNTSSSIQYITSINTNSLTVGIHTIIISVSKTDYFSKNISLDMNVISKWNSEIDIIESTALVTYGNNAEFIFFFYITETPRLNVPITGLSINQLVFNQKSSTQNQFILDIWTKGSLWDLEDLSTDPQYGPGYYRIWLLTSIVLINDTSAFTLQFTGLSNSPVIEDANAQSSISIRLPSSTLICTAPSLGGGLLESIRIQTNVSIIIEALWQITDTTSPQNGMYLTAGATISYVIYNSSNYALFTGNFTQNEFGNSFQASISVPFKGDFRVVVTGYQVNIQSDNASFDLLVGFDLVDYNIAINPLFKVTDTYIKGAAGENVSFYIQFNSTQAANPTINLTANIDGLYSLPIYRMDAGYYYCTFPVSQFTLTFHQLEVLGKIEGYVEKSQMITLEFFEEWESTIDVVVPPYLYPWNNISSMVIRYVSNELPRKGLLISGANITQILVRDEENTFQLLLGSDTMGTKWGWSEFNLNPYAQGYYRIWFNTSYVPVSTIKVYYVVFNITKPIYEQASTVTYMWVKPIETTIWPYLNGDTSSLLVYHEDYLNQANEIVLKVNTTDRESINYGQSITTSLMLYQIWRIDQEPFILIEEGSFRAGDDGYFRFVFPGVTLGYYSINFTSVLQNYSISTISTRFLVQGLPFNTIIDEKFQGTVVQNPANNEITMTFYIADQLTGEPISDANVTLIFNQNVPIRLDPTPGQPGYYSVSFTPEFFRGYKQNQPYPLTLYVSKLNYTTEVIYLTYELQFASDPYLGVPYIYWELMGVTLGIMISIVVIRKRIMWARIPLTLKHIIRANEIIKKKRSAPSKRWTLNAHEEMFKKYGREWTLLKLDFKETTGLSDLSLAGGMDEEMDRQMADGQATENIVDTLDQPEEGEV